MGIKFDVEYEDPLASKKHRKKLLDELDELEMDEGAFSISSTMPKKEKVEIKNEELNEKSDIDEWLDTIDNFKLDPIKRKGKVHAEDIFGISGGKKKKHKKKKKGDDLTDYNSEFETEMRLIKDLMEDQTKFTDSLQKKYDAMESTKSSARGIGKFTTDLIESINTSRSLSLQMVKEISSLKKTIADLSLKERKEFGSKASGNEEDIGLMSSSMLKQMISESAKDIVGDEVDIQESSMDDVYSDIVNSLGDDAGNDEIDKYLEYESRDITIYACVDKNSNGENITDAYFIAKDKDGDEIYDYPLPAMTTLKINRSTEVATDTYSRKYPIIWV